MAHKNNHLVIMAGGVGSRFWPMSTVDKPKQFIDVLGTEVVHFYSLHSIVLRVFVTRRMFG